MSLSPFSTGIGRATLLNTLGTIIPGLAMILTVPLYIRTIGDARYGVLTLVWLLIGYFGVFDLGFGRALTNRLAELPPQASAQRQQAFWTGLTLSLLAGLAGGILLFGMAYGFLWGHPSLAPLLKQETMPALPWAIVALPLATTLSVLSGALIGQKAFMSLNIGQIVGNLLFQLLPLAMALMFRPSLSTLIPAALLGRSSSLVLLAYFCRKQGLLSGYPQFSRPEIRHLLRYGGWVTVTALAGPLLTVVDRFVIGTLGGARAVTAYTVPFNLINTLVIFPASLQKALTPSLTATDDATAQQKTLEYTQLVLALMTPAVTLGLLLITPFLDFWVGHPLAQRAGPAGTILLLGLWVNTLAFIPFTTLQSRGRPDIPARFHLWELLPYGVGLWLLTTHFGVHGAAWAWDLRALADTLLLFHACNLLGALRQAGSSAAIMILTFALTAYLPYTSASYLLCGVLLVLCTLSIAWTRLPMAWRQRLLH